jgi:uncharacterized membrane protein YbhN (UPF0104 family)
VTDRRSARWSLGPKLVAIAVAAAALIVLALAAVPARLIEACAAWIVTAGVLELLSALGFVVFFKLVFAVPISWRRTAPAALRALAASTVLPGGPLIGGAAGAWSTSADKPSFARLARSTITFVILINAPGTIVLGALGTLLWLGLPSGPHQTALTILPAVLAVGLLIATWFAGRASRRHPPPRHRRKLWRALAKPTGTVSASITEARALVTARDWKLVGALAYYAFDNAVLWAAFHAYGHAPQIGVVVMGYLVGSLAGALPIRRPRSPRGWPDRSARSLRRARGPCDRGGTALPGHLARGTHRARRRGMHAPPEKPAASPRPAGPTTPCSVRAGGGTAGRFVVTGHRRNPCRQTSGRR